MMISSYLLAGAILAGSGQPNPVMFVTQFPIADDFATIGSTFANHSGAMQSVGRGGDLWIRYGDGTTRNLTAEAGFGVVGHQDDNAIAVRDPAVHWTGTKALFSMVIGAPEQYEWEQYYWQIYEITGFGQGQTVSITPVPNQPGDYNNVAPIYASDDRIIFVSDRPRDGRRHLYPQHDEYESTQTNTGLWSLDPHSGELFMMQHSPSGSFDPIIDSVGRVIFTRWDHLQRDQQAYDGNPYGTFDYASEEADAAVSETTYEVFPEPRPSETGALAGTNLEGHTINHFFPWQLNQNGTAEEVLNHLGRHELHTYFNRSLNDDSNLREFIASVSGRTNPNSILNMFQIQEHPGQPGYFVGVDAPEFNTHASGMIIGLDGELGANPDDAIVTYITDPLSNTVVGDGDTPPPGHPGHFRDPLVLSTGQWLAAHTAETRGANNDGTRANPDPRYDFRLRWLDQAGGYRVPGTELTDGIVETISYYDPDVLVSYSGPLWELSPVEVVTRPIAPDTHDQLEPQDLQVFTDLGIDPVSFSNWLRANQLGVLAVRDVTARDEADRQQPFNLQVAGSGHSTVGAAGTVYTVSDMQVFQGDQTRGIGGIDDPTPGRRVIAHELHDPVATLHNPPVSPGAPLGSQPIAADGSVALFVPARRAMAWQTTAADGEPVVRERYWITFQAGEVRVCDGCHGVNTVNQAGGGATTQTPQALSNLLQHWLGEFDLIFDDSAEP